MTTRKAGGTMEPIPLSAEQKARLEAETNAAVAAKRREYRREYRRRQATELAEFRNWKKKQGR